MIKKIFLVLFLMLLAVPAFAGHKYIDKSAKTVLGVDRVGEAEVDAIFAGQRVGVFSNQSGINSKLENSVDVLLNKYKVTAIFTPEHGLLGAVAAGENYSDAEYKGVKVFSLYGDTRRPTKEMLDTIDVMAVDIQDVGVRHYTYTSSLAYIMEECAKYNKKVVVFDRPNPLGGAVEGPVLKPQYKSFIGLYELPLRHGLTIGEFARFINTEAKINCPLEVVPMKNWQRSMLWADTKLPWVQTSPRIPTAETAVLYDVTGICGDTNLSIGTGTSKPFYFVGAPYADAEAVKQKLEQLNLKGVGFRKTGFVPDNGKFSGELVQAVELYIFEPKKINLPELGYTIAYTFQELYPKQMDMLPVFPESTEYSVNLALGESSLKKHQKPAEVFPRWREECKAFIAKASPYYLY